MSILLSIFLCIMSWSIKFDIFYYKEYVRNMLSFFDGVYDFCLFALLVWIGLPHLESFQPLHIFFCEYPWFSSIHEYTEYIAF